MPKRNNHDNGEARAAKERNRKRAKVRYERKMAKAAALLLINTFNSEISVTPTTRNIGSQTYDASLPQKFKIEGNGNSAIEMNPGNCIDCNP